MNDTLNVALHAITEKKAENILVYDFTSINPFIDKVVICSANNIRKVHAIANALKEQVKAKGLAIRSLEGNKDSRWVLVDLHQVIIHVFLDEERAHFQLEKLYADLPMEHINV